MAEIRDTKKTDALFEKIAELIEQARRHVVSTVNAAEVYTKYRIGQYIVEDEQKGRNRAEYGQRVLKNLSKRLTERFGAGWSLETLKNCRFFYGVYSSRPIGSTALTRLPAAKKVNGVDPIPPTKMRTNDRSPAFCLSWSHYLILMRIENPDERSFYEIECARQQWSVRQLQRQVASSLYERLALSRNKAEVMRLANEGQTMEKPADILKDPVTLEFLGLKPEAVYTETRLENAIISRLQTFLLEMGKGFLFEARQKRFSFDEENFYVDLVLYNRILQCYVLVDLKVDKLTHQDLGQMQMYVNYFDRHVKLDFEKPTIGILLCKTKKDALVELTLPEDANIYASAYELCLPDKALLQRKLRAWIDEFEGNSETPEA
ncbi:MAG: DUF1016 family protein [Lentisphaeria bacterium]|nr:DUF1016 family protein [Lentisphaeria bacterium]